MHGNQKQGAAYGYTRQLGYHPLLATRADTGEVLHIRMRTGSANSGRGAERFVNEIVGRVRRAGATGALTMRADSAFHSNKVIKACRRHQVAFSITVNQISAVRALIEQIPEDSWTPINYPEGGVAEVAEIEYHDKIRLIVRRTRLVGPEAKLWPDWRHHAFITNNRSGPPSTSTPTTAATPSSGWPTTPRNRNRVHQLSPTYRSQPGKHVLGPHIASYAQPGYVETSEGRAGTAEVACDQRFSCGARGI